MQTVLSNNLHSMEPKIRIEGKGNWTTKSLSDISKKVVTKNTALKYDVTLTNSAEFGIISQLDFFDHKISNDKSISNYYVVEPDDFVYNPRVSVTAPVGPINRNMLGFSGVMSPLYYVFKVHDVDKEFLDYYFHTRCWHKFMYDKGNSGARFDRLSISDSEFVKMPITMPKSGDEQCSIASYFRNLDNLISASNSRIASLRQMKVASLQAMFPQKGETMPRVRFKGFEGEYSSMTANELFKTFDERNHPELPVLSACQDIRGMAPRSESGYDIFHDKSNEVTYKRVLPGQFVIHLRSFQGGFAHSSVEGICSPAYTVFGFKEDDKHDDYYWKYIFMSKAFIDRLKLITYGIRDGRSISFKEFMEMDFVFPSYEEQKQISIFFRTIDKQISLEEQKLESLKRIKSACLDKMFV